MNNLTKQEIFNKVYTHLLTQKEKAIDKGKCKYRLQKEDKILRCAAGCLIPDDKYNSDFEGFSFYFISKPQNEKQEKFAKVQKELGLFQESKFIGLLQLVHDNFFVEQWKNRLEEIAAENDLKVPELSCS